MPPSPLLDTNGPIISFLLLGVVSVSFLFILGQKNAGTECDGWGIGSTQAWICQFFSFFSLLTSGGPCAKEFLSMQKKADRSFSWGYDMCGRVYLGFVIPSLPYLYTLGRRFVGKSQAGGLSCSRRLVMLLILSFLVTLWLACFGQMKRQGLGVKWTAIWLLRETKIASTWIAMYLFVQKIAV
ncbi:hypothetical protein B0T17DRAFT_209789 [Bombardia bombarda]|uniref:Uncharacterized protein n=1 Tax=Bombardia bombarda TaxID=252184 RepID=A0AA40C967_9PEZI|nr:hypothetical protein B0T17DRAFT_209789 [Bombardia bombarda]